MTAYVIAEVEVLDAEAFKAYGPLVRAAVEHHGGSYVVRGATVTPLEGEAPKRIAMLAFENAAAAKRWHESPEYREAKAIRLRSTNTRMFIVE